MIRYDLIDYRDAVISARKRALRRKVSKMEVEIYDQIIEAVSNEMLKQGGFKAAGGGMSMSLINTLEVIFGKFRDKTTLTLLTQIARDIDKISKATNAYFFGTMTLEKGVIEGFGAVAEQAIRSALGLGSRGGILAGGMIDKLTKAPSIRDKVMKFLYDAFAQGMDGKQMMNGINDLLISNKDKNGALIQQFAPLIYDGYQQYERTYNRGIANYLGMRCFIYAGGLIETSRDFCIKKNNKVFTIWEADEWKDDNDLLLTNEERRRGGPIDYVPLRDLGRWRCRHMINFISDEEAIKLRPSLKSVLKKNVNNA